MTKKKKKKKKVEIKSLEERKGKCLMCQKPMYKNHKRCKACLRKIRRKRELNRRGKSRKY